MTAKRAARQVIPSPGPGALFLFVILTSAATSGADLSQYEYEYDELPRPHLAIREAPSPPSHIQHVPVDAPRHAEASESSAIQRVPRSSDAVPAAVSLQSAPPPEPAPGADGAEGETRPQATPVPTPPALAQMNSNEASGSDARPKVPSSTSPKKGSDDMETANFFWGLGPIYPHLYVYRRIPHLVPLPGWSPYHYQAR